MTKFIRVDLGMTVTQGGQTEGDLLDVFRIKRKHTNTFSANFPLPVEIADFFSYFTVNFGLFGQMIISKFQTLQLLSV